MNLRNIAIIAHVDHGKTTLVDKILHQANLFRDNQEKGDLILDNNDLERERGITIFSKNVSIQYKDTKINIIDTPGHSDFGGEVERVLKMADGVILLVDAFEGTMPQTRFVLKKALELGLKPIVVVNKVDKPNCRPDEVHDSVFELFFQLDATEEQLEFPTLYGSAKQGWYGKDWKNPTDNISPLLDAIIEYVPPASIKEGPLQMQITSLEFSNFTGRIAVGKIERGEIKEGAPIKLMKTDGTIQQSRVKELYVFEGLGKRRIDSVKAGDICAVVGIENFGIGDTIADFENPEALEPIHVDEPTMSMMFMINNSPFYGQDGKFVTSRHLRDRLMKETEKNLALRVKETDSSDSFLVFGRGILHLSILIETMRREGYELMVGQPQVLLKEVDGKTHEPYEVMVVDVPAEFSGKVIELASMRKGELLIMETKGEMQHLEFDIPSRGLIGLRSQMLTATTGEAVMNHRLNEYREKKGQVPRRLNGVMVSIEQGATTAYSLDGLQDRGTFFVDAGETIYNGQIVGENNRPTDLGVNIVRAKKMSNMRASGKDDSSRIAPKTDFSLEEALEYIQEDECVEVTPKVVRMRKLVLDEGERKRREKSMGM